MKRVANKFQYYAIELKEIAEDYNPNNNLFLFCFFLFKFVGLMIFSNCLEHVEKDKEIVFSFYSLLRKVTFFGNFKHENLTGGAYEYPLLLIYIVLLVPAVLWLWLLIKYSLSKTTEEAATAAASPSMVERRTKGISSFVHISFSKPFKKCIRFTMVLYTLTVLCSQYLIEYLFFPLCLFIPSSSINTPMLQNTLETIEASLIANKIALLTLNSVFIVLINLYTWFFIAFFSSPFLSHDFVFKFNFDNYFLMLFIFISNFQAFHYYPFVIKSTFTQISCTVIAFVISVLLLLLAFRRYVEGIALNYIIVSFSFCSSISCIMSLLLFLTIDPAQEVVTTEMYFVKIIVTVLLVFVCLFGIIMIQSRVYSRVIIENLFRKNKIAARGEYLYHLASILKKCLKDTRKLASLFELIESSKHKQTQGLLGTDSNSQLTNPHFFYTKFKSKLIPDENQNFNQKQMDFQDQYRELLILIESEISSFIFNAFKNKEINDARIPLLHCDFIYYLKGNASFSLYLIQEYLSKIGTAPFISTIQFYTLKCYILKERDSQLNANLNGSNLNIKLKSFLSYYQIIENIKDLLFKGCCYIQRVIMIKNIYCEANQKATQQNRANIKHLFNYCVKMDETLSKLSSSLEENFRDKPLKTPEMCFLLTNFFEITSKKVPEKLSHCLQEMNAYESLMKFESDFLDRDFDHPMIMSLSPTGKDEHLKDGHRKGKSHFYIDYLSQKLINYLGYRSSDLIGKDFNILIPQMITEAHSVEMKKVLFLSQEAKIDHSAFLLSKDQYYIQIIHTSGMLPSLNTDMKIISNITLQPHNSNHYFFIVDIDSNIVSMTRNFEDKFMINYQMIQRLNIQFYSLFALRENEIKHAFKDRLELIRSINIENSDSLIGVFNQNGLDNMILGYEQSSKQKESKIIRLSKKKHKMKASLLRIKKQIEEQEYDTDWLARITSLEQQWNYKKDSEANSFELAIELHHLGNCPYFYIQIVDTDDLPHEITELSLSSNILTVNDFAQQAEYLKKKNENLRKLQMKISDDFLFRKKGILTNRISALASSNTNNTSHLMNDTKQHLLHIKRQSVNQNQFRKSLMSRPPIKTKAKQIQTKEFNKRRKKIKFILTSLILFLIGGLAILFAVNFYIKETGISIVRESNALVFLLLKVKESILESALLVTSGCYRLADLEPNPYENVDFSIEMLKAELYLRSSEMFTHYNRYNEYLNKYYYYPELYVQQQQQFKVRTYKRINYDFSINTYESTFINEFHYFHYSCGFIKDSNSFTQCRVRKYFFGGLDLSAKVTAEGDNGIATDDEVFFYYTTQNVLGNFLDSIEEFIVQSLHFIFKTTNQKETEFLIVNISILLCGFAIIGLMLVLAIAFKNTISNSFDLFIEKSKTAQLIERKLNNFKTILIAFDSTVCEQYELTKFVIENKKDGIVGIKEKSTESIKPKKPLNNKKLAIEEKTKESEDDDEKTKQQSITITLFSLRILQAAMIHFILSFLSFSSLIIVNIAIDSNLFNEIYFSTGMAYSYLDRTPSLNEILLYYRVSILEGDTHFLQLPRTSYSDRIFSQTSTELSVNIDLENDARYVKLGDSKMSFLFYKKELQFAVIPLFESSHKNSKSILHELKGYSKSISIEGQACDYFSDAYKTHIATGSSLFNAAFLENACQSLNNGNLNSGFQNHINQYFFGVFNEYLDFAANPSGDLVFYSELPSFIGALKLMTLIYNISWHISSVLATNDLSQLFKKVKVQEMIFQFSGLILSTILCGIYFLVIFGALRRSAYSFEDVIKKINTVLSE